MFARVIRATTRTQTQVHAPKRTYASFGDKLNTQNAANSLKDFGQDKPTMNTDAFNKAGQNPNVPGSDLSKNSGQLSGDKMSEGLNSMRKDPADNHLSPGLNRDERGTIPPGMRRDNWNSQDVRDDLSQSQGVNRNTTMNKDNLSFETNRDNKGNMSFAQNTDVNSNSSAQAMNRDPNNYSQGMNRDSSSSSQGLNRGNNSDNMSPGMNRDTSSFSQGMNQDSTLNKDNLSYGKNRDNTDSNKWETDPNNSKIPFGQNRDTNKDSVFSQGMNRDSSSFSQGLNRDNNSDNMSPGMNRDSNTNFSSGMSKDTKDNMSYGENRDSQDFKNSFFQDKNSDKNDKGVYSDATMRYQAQMTELPSTDRIQDALVSGVNNKSKDDFPGANDGAAK